MKLKVKWFLIVLVVATVVAGSIFVFMPHVSVYGEGTLSVSLTTNEPPQLDLISISDIPAYGVLEPSGCGEYKGKVKLRIDCFLTPDAPYYDKHYVEVIDTTSSEFLLGYLGKVDEKTGEPLDWDDYQKWEDSLPTVWQNNPFHCHFVYFDADVTDDTIKAKVVEVTEYFYAFHFYCWDNGEEFISEWQKVPIQVGTIRDVLIAGDSSPPNKVVCEDKATDITIRKDDFDTRQLEKVEPSPVPLNIGDKGTIDVGSAATDRASNRLVYGYGNGWTLIDYNNAANDAGSIDTVQAWFYSVDSGNSFKVGTFTDNGSASFTCNDAELIGEVTAGSQQEYTGLSIDISTGEFIGCDWRANFKISLEKDAYGHSGVYSKQNETLCDPSDTATFTLESGDALSLYGTGTEAGGFDIANTPASEDLGVVAVNTTYYAKGSAPNNPVEDGDCTFTVTNNGDACDLDMKVGDFTGGVGWNIDATPAADEAKITAYYSGQDPASGLVLANTDAEFYDGLASSGTIKWDFSMLTGTSFSDGVEKSATLTITAVAED